MRNGDFRFKMGEYKMAKTEMVNMVMVHDPATNRVVVQNRVQYWCGAAFPGGHVEDGESIYESAIREVWEETGLTVTGLIPCGIMHWFNNRTGDRYMVWFYKTTQFTGELLPATEEGSVCWVELDRIRELKLAPNFDQYLEMFLDKGYSEIFCSWNDEDNPQDAHGIRNCPLIFY